MREGKRCRHGEVAEDGGRRNERGVRVREDPWTYGKRTIRGKEQWPRKKSIAE